MHPRQRIDLACRLMAAFAARTGLSSGDAARRYLWTDAHAVCTLLALHRATGQPHYGRWALALVDLVHEILGRHRPDDPRRGWISGLDDVAGRARPTAGGLRIGKPLPERKASETLDERSEWDRDGQYFHYLTRWMHALACVAEQTHEERYLLWAVELARVAHAAFAFTRPDGRRALRWKMSVDLSRPLVPSMGHHDALDGLVTCLELRSGLLRSPGVGNATVLEAAIEDLRAMTAATNPTTDDPLGLGGVLTAAHTVVRVMARGHSDGHRLLASLLRSSVVGLRSFASHGTVQDPPEHRLAFRELGLAIGLEAVPSLASLLPQGHVTGGLESALHQYLAALSNHLPLAATIVGGWCAPAPQSVASWQEHLDINEVMLATALVPAGYLST